MDDESIEADLLAAHLVPFARDEAGWTNAYVTSISRMDPKLASGLAQTVAAVAWRAHGWAHPAVVAHLEHAQALHRGD